MRAKFCESLALKTKLASQAAELFLMGLFSLMDVFLGRPMEEILEQIPLSGEIKDALRGQGNPANLVLKLVVHYEKGSWEAVSPLITQLGLDEAEVPETYARDAEFVEYIPLACLA